MFICKPQRGPAPLCPCRNGSSASYFCCFCLCLDDCDVKVCETCLKRLQSVQNAAARFWPDLQHLLLWLHCCCNIIVRVGSYPRSRWIKIKYLLNKRLPGFLSFVLFVEALCDSVLKVLNNKVVLLLVLLVLLGLWVLLFWFSSEDTLKQYHDTKAHLVQPWTVDRWSWGLDQNPENLILDWRSWNPPLLSGSAQTSWGALRSSAAPLKGGGSYWTPPIGGHVPPEGPRPLWRDHGPSLSWEHLGLPRVDLQRVSPGPKLQKMVNYSRMSLVHNNNEFCLSHQDHCSVHCPTCCPDVSVCDRCFRLAEMCDCRLPSVHSLLPNVCSSLSVRSSCCSSISPGSSTSGRFDHMTEVLFIGSFI